MTVTEFDKLKGAIYETYYLTLPGLPIICSFFRIINKTGVYMQSTETTRAYLKIADNMKDVYANCYNPQNRYHRQRAGEAWQNATYVNTVKFSGTRQENLYVFHGSKLNPAVTNVLIDNKTIAATAEHNVNVATQETYTSQPTFYLISEKDIPEGALDDLERISF